MKRLLFRPEKHAMITAIMCGQTPEEMIAEARNAEFDGAHGIAIDLCDLKPEFRNRETFERIIGSVNLPFMFVFYRTDRWSSEQNDDARQEVLLTASEAGAGMIDVMGDLYDPSPEEYTRSSAAIEKQMRLMERIHGNGSEVVISSHVNRSMRSEEVLERMQAFERRGADVVKMVTLANTEEEFAEAIRTTMLLRRELNVPFIYLCSGAFARPQRFLGMTLGVSITFAVHAYNRYLMPQPTIQSMKTVLDNLHWHIDGVPSSKS